MTKRMTLILFAAALLVATAVVAGTGVREVRTSRLSGSAAPAPPPPWVGAYAPVRPQKPQQHWDTVNKELGGGKLTYRRSFDPTIPPAGKEAWRATNARFNFYSVKPPGGDVAGYIAGRYDSRMRTMVRALPKKTVIAVYHEPENDMRGARFAAVTKKTVSVVRSVRPDVKVWYVAMAYQWQSNSKGNTGSNAGWIDAAKAADGVGVDVYSPPWYFTTMEKHKGFSRWWREIKQPSGKPWGVIERGIAPDRGAEARAGILRADWSYAKAHGAKFFLYWNANLKGTAWDLAAPKEKAAHRAIAAQGRD